MAELMGMRSAYALVRYVVQLNSCITTPQLVNSISEFEVGEVLLGFLDGT